MLKLFTNIFVSKKTKMSRIATALKIRDLDEKNQVDDYLNDVLTDNSAKFSIAVYYNRLDVIDRILLNPMIVPDYDIALWYAIGLNHVHLVRMCLRQPNLIIGHYIDEMLTAENFPMLEELMNYPDFDINTKFEQFMKNGHKSIDLFLQHSRTTPTLKQLLDFYDFVDWKVIGNFGLIEYIKNVIKQTNLQDLLDAVNNSAWTEELKEKTKQMFYNPDEFILAQQSIRIEIMDYILKHPKCKNFLGNPQFFSHCSQLSTVKKLKDKLEEIHPDWDQWLDGAIKDPKSLKGQSFSAAIKSLI